MKYITPYDEFVQLNEAVGSSIVRWVQSGIVPKETFDHILQQDPSRGKFVDKMVEWFTQGIALPEILQTIQTFFVLRNKKQIDEIQKFKTYNELLQAIQDRSINLYSSGTDSYKKYGKLTYDVLQNDDKVFVAKINSLADSVYFGDKRGWCISDTSTKIFENGHYYNNYRKSKASIFFIFNKNLINTKQPDKTVLAAFYPGKKHYEIRADHNEELKPNGKEYLKSIGTNMSLLKADFAKMLDLSKYSQTQIDFIHLLGYTQAELDNDTKLENGIMYIEYVESNPLIDFIDDDENEHIHIKDWINEIPDDVKIQKINIDLQHDMVINKDLIDYCLLLDQHKLPYKLINIGDYVLINGYKLDDPKYTKLINNLIKYSWPETTLTITQWNYKDLSILNWPTKPSALTIHNSDIQSLKGCPYIMGPIDLNYNDKLSSLEGLPEIIFDDLEVSFNPKLKSLKGFPKEIIGDLTWNSNGIKITETQIRKICEVQGKIFIT